MAPILIDSYSETNRTGDTPIHAAAYYRRANSFTSSGNYVLNNAVFQLSKTGTPTGSAYAMLFTHSGTYGTDSVGGTLLATSDAIDVSTLTGTPTLTQFNFSGAERVALAADYYVIAFQYNAGDAGNAVLVAFDTTGEASGNTSLYNDSGWVANAGDDIPFYVYGDVPSTGNNMMLLGIG